MKKHFSDEQIISILRGAEAGVSAWELCCKHAIQLFSTGKALSEFGGMSGENITSGAAGVSCFSCAR